MIEMRNASVLGDLLKQVRHGLDRVYGKRLKEIYLFGSYARGEADANSDVDLAIVLDEIEDLDTDRERSIDVLAPLSLENNLVLAPIILDYEDLISGRFAIHRSILREGITL